MSKPKADLKEPTGLDAVTFIEVKFQLVAHPRSKEIRSRYYEPNAYVSELHLDKLDEFWENTCDIIEKKLEEMRR